MCSCMTLRKEGRLGGGLGRVGEDSLRLPGMLHNVLAAGRAELAPENRRQREKDGRLRFISSTITFTTSLFPPSRTHPVQFSKMAGTNAKFPIDMSKLQKCVQSIAARNLL